MDTQTASVDVRLSAANLASRFNENGGKKIPAAQVREIAKAGKLLGRDHKIDLVEFTAFLLKDMKNR